jgi:hypothetical protein
MSNNEVMPKLCRIAPGRQQLRNGGFATINGAVLGASPDLGHHFFLDTLSFRQNARKSNIITTSAASEMTASYVVHRAIPGAYCWMSVITNDEIDEFVCKGHRDPRRDWAASERTCLQNGHLWL